MTAISIVPETNLGYRAIAGQQQSTGRTPGEALDSLTAQLDKADSGTLIVVQQMRPDQFFSEAQRLRLAALMEQWRQARDRGEALPAAEQAELEQLTAAELEAARRRSVELQRELPT
jgi:hypothetical protein